LIQAAAMSMARDLTGIFIT